MRKGHLGEKAEEVAYFLIPIKAANLPVLPFSLR
jgi:hypothetical protein